MVTGQRQWQRFGAFNFYLILLHFVELSKVFGELNLAECVTAMGVTTQKVNGGDLAGLEAMLAAQAVTLNAMFTQLAHQTSKMTVVDQIDWFTRLALKAQGQCRTTVETLAQMKNSPIFARQANIANGPQQVNNGTPSRVRPRAREIRKPSRTNYWRPLVNGWTLERRARQSAAIRNWRPREHSTGPRSLEGKARVSCNAWNGGQRLQWRALCRVLNAELRAQRERLAST